MRILILDNYDSFTYNLVHLIEKTVEAEIDVVKNDKINPGKLDVYNKIILSPGPGLFSQAGLMPLVIQQAAGNIPILGVCLGMQAIGEFYGAPLVNLETVMHGIQTKIIIQPPSVLFKNCPGSFKVGRYHSWVIATNHLPKHVYVSAYDEHGFIMAIEDTEKKIYGVQFHPESILSEHGKTIIENWLAQ